MTREIILAGCTTTPLSGYLKALGIFRLIANHHDTQATAYWREESFVITSSLSAESLQSFLLEDYSPTPIIAPWNGGSGFFASDNQTGISALQEAKAGRFSDYRMAIETSRKVLESLQLSEKPDGDMKYMLLSALRSELPEKALDWLDAAVVLTEDSPKYPPLLGTGGNDGRLDFTNNFMQRITELIDTDSGKPQPHAIGNLRQALFGEAEPGLKKAAIGQFSPGNAGGANQQSGFSSDALINPWDFILMIEGAILFAASTSRRFGGSAQGALSYPFTVRPTGSGAGNAVLGDEGNARAEIWMPLWSSGCTLGELKSILSEGRVTVGKKPARDGLDFVRAVSSLGIDRGISAFQRYAFMMRSGKAYLATPLNRVPVSRTQPVN
jgi:CRISPR-associated protein Csx17